MMTIDATPDGTPPPHHPAALAAGGRRTGAYYRQQHATIIRSRRPPPSCCGVRGVSCWRAPLPAASGCQPTSDDHDQQRNPRF